MMATENKRHVSGKSGSAHAQEGFGPSGTVSLEKALSAAIGARIRVTTTPPATTTIEGTLFTACPITNIIAINTSPSSNFNSNASASAPTPASPALALAQPSDFTILPISRINSFNLLSLTTEALGNGAPFTSAQPSIYPLDIRSLRAREAAAIARVKEHESSRGKGVSKEAQDLFDAFRRTMPTHWSGTSIVVADSVIIAAPYGVGDCKTLSVAGRDEVAGTALTRVRKVLEMERKKIELRRASTAMANSVNFHKSTDASSRKNSTTTTTSTAVPGSSAGSATGAPAAARAPVAVPIRSNPSSSSPSGGQRKGG